MPKSSPQEDNVIGRHVRRQLNRRYVDCSKVQVRVSYGVVYLTGEMRKPRGFQGTLKDELEIIRNILLHIQGIKEIADHDLRLVE
ncbi:MAG: hypothetical protein GTO55_09405 [Armatimonadetes bacterium]|nr:hypothetical protein [Armatimonadota bacterium]NIM24463.1 hypothetical protein [Armatimonadota bacterium]NIM68334.1 hypothetical protein [Armatimonadota bacterium]NIM76738.1 hypothetical protein [Armatimonadota bacterium]NIN06537.1 hypothetical protein [Armatimonadota bacterium]